MALTIGQVARRTGIGLETVRFYERQGLIENPPRTSSGYRQYPETVVSRIRFIRRAKQLGFTLREIGELLSLRHDPKATAGDVRVQAQAKIADIAAKIRDLERIKRTLEELTDACPGRGPTSECPILAALEQRPD